MKNPVVPRGRSTLEEWAIQAQLERLGVKLDPKTRELVVLPDPDHVASGMGFLRGKATIDLFDLSHVQTKHQLSGVPGLRADLEKLSLNTGVELTGATDAEVSRAQLRALVLKMRGATEALLQFKGTGTDEQIAAGLKRLQQRLGDLHDSMYQRLRKYESDLPPSHDMRDFFLASVILRNVKPSELRELRRAMSEVIGAAGMMFTKLQALGSTHPKLAQDSYGKESPTTAMLWGLADLRRFATIFTRSPAKDDAAIAPHLDEAARLIRDLEEIQRGLPGASREQRAEFRRAEESLSRRIEHLPDAQGWGDAGHGEDLARYEQQLGRLDRLKDEVFAAIQVQPGEVRTYDEVIRAVCAACDQTHLSSPEQAMRMLKEPVEIAEFLAEWVTGTTAALMYSQDWGPARKEALRIAAEQIETGEIVDGRRPDWKAALAKVERSSDQA